MRVKEGVGVYGEGAKILLGIERSFFDYEKDKTLKFIYPFKTTDSK